MDQRAVDLHESVFNATWSYLETNCADHPLGMKISSGTPPQMWTKDTLDEQPYIFFSEDICDLYSGGTVLLVLTSKMGWPYTKFDELEDRNEHLGGGEFYRDVFVRRGIVRVSTIVMNDVGKWLSGEQRQPTPFILAGTPGMGRTAALGPYLLHQLVH
ncbi:putative Retrotransposon hot spot protein [Trypanosoma vivax]|nr:hypothetical protein TRVL_10013 [Trypanosoma vivax]KAH8620053.1 putative Retrotransposon hot spot protein [Trypanosoma vivax]